MPRSVQNKDKMRKGSRQRSKDEWEAGIPEGEAEAP